MELLRRGYWAEIEHAIKVKFKHVIVGEYSADVSVDNKVIVEFKVAKKYNSQDERQLLNESKATGIKLGLLINSWTCQEQVSAKKK